MKPFSNTELSSFCGQIALFLKASIPVTEGLSLMAEDSTSPEEKEVLDALLTGMEETASLYESLKRLDICPPYMLNMIQLAEETGTLDNVMTALQKHYDREDSIRRSIRSSVTYPMIMTGMMAAVIVVLLVKVLPVFNQVFIQLGSELTGFSRALMNVGAAISRYSAVFLVLLVVIVALIFYGTRTASGRNLVRRIGYKLKFTRTIYEETAACRFASGMALTLSSSINPERGLELVTGLNDDPVFHEKLTRCQEMVNDGTDLPKALVQAHMFTGVYARMVSIGEKTGSMDQVMEQLAELYQDDIDTRMNNVLAVLEPTLVVMLSLIVGVILLSVMLPLMGIMSGI